MFTGMIRGLLVAFLFLQSFWVSAKKDDSSGYRTIYTCEGRILNLVCNTGVIHLVRANYGRFSISICNDHGNLDWRVNCMSQHSFPIMQERCHLKSSCSVNATSSTFHDPCPRTLKYLEVQYHCGPEILPLPKPTVTTEPAVLKATQPPNVTIIPQHGKQTVTYRPIVTSFHPILPTTTTKFPLPISSNVVSSTHVMSTTDIFKASSTTPSYGIKSIDEFLTPLRTTSTTVTAGYSIDEYCAPNFSRGINWTWTKAGQTAISRCPEGATGTVEWHCNKNPTHWSTDTPHLVKCQSLWMENIKRNIQKGNDIIGMIEQISKMAVSKQIYSADLKVIRMLLNEALDQSYVQMSHYLDTWHRYHILREYLQNTIYTLNNLLDSTHASAWNDLPFLERKKIASDILMKIDKSAKSLLDVSGEDRSFTLIKKNVYMSLQVTKLNKLQTLSQDLMFPVFVDTSLDEEGINWIDRQDNILLSRESIEDLSKNGLCRLVFLAYNNLNDYMKPGSTISYYSEDKDDGKIARVVNSRILSVALENRENIKLKQPVIVTFQHIIDGDVTNPLCVFWDFHKNEWSALGCWLESSNKSHTTCQCDHLTNFALLMDLQPDFANQLDSNFLQVIVYVGCIIAIVTLLIEVIVLLLSRSDGVEDSIFIHRNMFICLLISEVIFAGGMKLTKFSIPCGITAGLAQYFFLAFYVWLFFECYHLHALLTRSCDAKKLKTWWYYPIAYTVPLIITGTSVAIDPSSYGTKHHCFLRADNYYVFSFVGPAIGIIFVGVIYLSISARMLYRNMSLSTSIMENDNINLSMYRLWTLRTVVLILAQSLTWSFGFIFINQQSVSLAYVFSILNGLQGCIILALFCILDKEGQSNFIKTLRNYLCFKKKKEHNSIPIRMNGNTTADNNALEFQTVPTENHLESACSTYDSSSLPPSSAHEIVSNMRSQNVVRVAKEDENHQSSLHSEGEPRTRRNIASGHPRFYKEFLDASDENSQFSEHIYESIDYASINEHPREHSTLSCQRFLPHDDCCEDASSLSHQPSSNYGFDQETVIFGQQNSQFSYTLPKDSHIHPYVEDARNHSHTFRRPKNSSCLSMAQRSVNHEHSQNPLHSHVMPIDRRPYPQNLSNENWKPAMPDLLRNPADSSVVLAVLDGEKVVSRIQQEEVFVKPHYNVRTYC